MSKFKQDAFYLTSTSQERIPYHTLRGLQSVYLKSRRATDVDTEKRNAGSLSEKKAPKAPVTPSVQTSGSKTLFVGNLPFSLEQNDVENFFKDIGEVVEVRLALRRGFGHVDFATAEAAQKALQLNDQQLLGRELRLDLAEERGSFTPQSGCHLASPMNGSIYQNGKRGQGLEVFVRGFDMFEEEEEIRNALNEHFGSCGPIARISIPTHPEGAVKGIAFIRFKDSNSLSQALELDNSKLGGYALSVLDANPRGDGRDCRGGGRRDRGGGGGGRFWGRRGGCGRGRGTPSRPSITAGRFVRCQMDHFPSLDESKRLIVFAVDKPNKATPFYEGVEFYAFDKDFKNEQGESSDIDPPQIVKPLCLQAHCHLCQCYASLEGRVYCVGGSRLWCKACRPIDINNRASEFVDCWDAINNHWTKSMAEMKVARESCVLHVLGKKLYATGYPMSRRDGRSVFIEMLDVSEARWTVLPYPPPYVKLDLDHFVSAAVEHKGYILFGSCRNKYFYAYTPPQTWRLMRSLPFDPAVLLYQPLYSLTVAGSHLLWLSGHDGLTIVGFDIDHGKYFVIDLASEGVLPCDGSLLGFPCLVYVGNGVLALVWSDVDCHYHCSRFSIYFVNGQPMVKGVSQQSCIGPKFMQTLVTAFVVDLDVPAGNPSK